MRCSVRCKGVILLSVLLVHTALGSPIVKRDVRLLLADDGQSYDVADPRISLVDADVFGGEAHENGNRDKRTLFKVKALGLGVAAKAVGAGVKAVGTGVKTVAFAGAKTVGKAALKVATTVGVKVAKAAITIGIAKLLLNLVFGKINQLIDFKTKLLGNVGNGKGLLSSSNLSSLSNSSGSSSSGGSAGADASASFDGAETTEGSAGDSEIGEDLPNIDPQKVSLQISPEVISAGFNVVNKAAPVVGEVIQRTAERLVGVGASLKPLFASSLGFGAGSNFKRETGENNDNDPLLEQENQASENDEVVLADAPSQFKRESDPSPIPSSPLSSPEPANNDSETLALSIEELKRLENALLARKVIERLLEKQAEKELAEAETSTPAKRETISLATTQGTAANQSPSISNPNYNQQYREQAQNELAKSETTSPAKTETIILAPTQGSAADQSPPVNSPYYNQQYRDYNPHVKRQAPNYQYYQYQPYQNVPRYRQQFTNQYYQNGNPYYAY